MSTNTRIALLLADTVWTGCPSASLLQPGAVAISNGRIVAVGAPNAVQAELRGSSKKVESFPGCCLLPGLINTHVHLTFSAGPDPVSDFHSSSKSSRLMLALQNAQQLLYSGVTCTRDCGSRGYELLTLRDGATQAEFSLPRLIISGPPLTPTGGHLWWMGGEANGPDGIRRGVRQRKKHGVDSLKIMATGGQMTPGTYPERPSYSQSELDTAADEGRRWGLSTAAHCLCAEGVMRAARAGVDSIEHCVFFQRLKDGRLLRGFDSYAAKEVAKSGASVMPGLSAGYHRSDGARAKQIPSDPLAVFALNNEKLMFEAFSQLLALSIPIVVGTDAGVALTPFDETWLELALLVKAGMTPADALEAATANAACTLGLSDKLGTLEKGKYADVIACFGNPLEDIHALEQVIWVMREGQVIRDDRVL